jgi:1,4-dihydroxy-2-naphthoate octaprenyltransferase
LPALAALVGSLLIQIGTNLTNDYYDFKNGADTAARLGPTRVTQSGLIAPSTVLFAAVGAFLAAVGVGLYLVAVGGWPILVIGILSVLAGFAYTGGPYPLGYHGLGDVFVFLFFGLVAVCGTYYVQAGSVAPAAWLAALPVGAIGTAILVVNNLRDESTDVQAGKRTLVVRLGVRAGKAEYLTLMGVALAIPVAMWLSGLAGPGSLLALLGLPAALPPIRRVLRESGRALNPALGETARLQLVFGLLFSLGLWL